MTTWAAIVLQATLFAGLSLAADDPAVLKDLTAVIALQGQPCGQVVTAVVWLDQLSSWCFFHSSNLLTFTPRAFRMARTDPIYSVGPLLMWILPLA